MVLAPNSRAAATEGDKLIRLFQIQERSCETLRWHLRGAARRHDNPLKVVSSFISGACNPAHAELAALRALWSLPPSRRRQVQAAFDELTGELASILEQVRSAGAIRSCDCLVAAQLVLGLVLWTPVAAHQAPPRKLLNGRRLIEGLQDLLIHGRSGDQPKLNRLAAAGRHPDGMATSRDYSGDTLRFVVSRMINRAGVEAVTAASIAAELACSEAGAAEALQQLQPVLVSCQQRTIALVLQIRDQAFAGDDEPGFVALIRGLAEAYLRDDVQPLSPLAGCLPGASGVADPIRLRWQMTWELFRQRQVDGVAKGEGRTVP
jgi:hypothetical protein